MPESERNGLEPLLNTAQAAAYLGKHPNTIRRYVREKLIPFVWVGGELRYRRADLESWIRKRLGRAKKSAAVVLLVASVAALTGCASPADLPAVAHAFQSCNGTVKVVGGPARDTVLVPMSDCGGQVEQPVGR